MKGFRSRVNAEAKAAAKQSGKSIETEFGRTGVAAGKKMGAGVKSGAVEAQKAVNDLSKANASATAAWATANRQNSDQLGRVRVAQSQVNDAVRKYGADSTQAITAQERLAAAQRKAEETGVRLVNAQSRMGESQKALKVGQDQLAAALEKSDKAAGKAGGGFSRFVSGARGAVGSVTSVLGQGLSGVWSGIQRAASVTGQAIGTAFKVGAGIAGVAITGLLVKMTTGGFSRLANIENAQAKMTGLGFAAEDVSAAMDGASDAVDGTSFALDEMASAASVAMAAGLKPGEQLNAYMKTLKNAASAANTPLSEMAPILNKVVTSQRAYTAEINQIADRGLPIWTKLQEAYGVTADELRDMVSRGEVDAETFFRVMDEMTGSVADAMGNTTTAKIKNFGTAINKLGADMLSGLYPVLGPLFDAMKSGVQMIQAVLKPAFEGLGDSVSPVSERLTAFTDKWVEIKARIEEGGDPLALISESFPKFGAFLEKLQDGISGIPQMLETFSSFWGPLAEAMGPLAREIGPLLAAALKEIGEALAPILPQLGEALLDAVVQLAPPLADLLAAILPLVPPLVELLAALAPLAAELVEILAPALEWIISNGLTPMFEAIEALIGYLSGDIGTGDFVGKVGELLGPMLGFVNGLIEFLAGIRDFITDVVSHAVSIWVTIQQVFTSIQTFVQQVLLTIATIFTNIWNGIVSFVTGAITGIRTTISDVLNGISSIWNNVWNGVVSAFTGFVNNIVGTVGQIGSAVAGIGDTIWGALSGIGTWLVDSGRALIQGFIDGIGQMVGAAGDAVGGVLDWVGGFFPNSPAKRGPLSGSGWTRIKRSGEAYMEQWTGGVESGAASFSIGDALAAADATSRMLGSGFGSAASAGPASTVQKNDYNFNGPIYGDPQHVADEIERNSRRSQAVFGIGGIA